MKAWLRALALPVVGAIMLVATLAWGAYMGGFPAWLLGMGAASIAVILAGLLWQERGRLRDSVLSLAYCLFVLLSCVFVYLIAANRTTRWDITRHAIHTLSPQTVALLHEVDRPVEVALFCEPRDFPNAGAFLRLYAGECPNLTFAIYDPVEQASVARQYADIVHPNDAFISVIEDGQVQSRQRIVLDPTDQRRENALSNAILKGTRGANRQMYLTTGKGERSPVVPRDRPRNEPEQAIGTMARIWADRVMPLSSANLYVDGRIPDDAAILIIAGPRSDLFDIEREMIFDFLDEGGALLLMLDPLVRMSATPNLDAVLARAGLAAPNHTIIDPFAGQKGVAVAAKATDHPILRGARSLRLSFRHARPILLQPETSDRSATVTPLLFGGPRAFHRDTEKWLLDGAPMEVTEDAVVGEPILAAVSTWPATNAVRGEQARVVVIGDSDFILDGDEIDNDKAAFALAAVNWLAARNDQLAIPPRLVPPSTIAMTQGRFWTLVGVLILIGLSILVGGTGYATARRRSR